MPASRWNLKLNPVLILAGVVAVLQAVLAYSDIENLIPNPVLNWLRLTLVVFTVLGAFVARSKVTPLADPRDEHGFRLIPQVRQQAAAYGQGPPRSFASGTSTFLASPSEGHRGKGVGDTTHEPPRDAQG